MIHAHRYTQVRIIFGILIGELGHPGHGVGGMNFFLKRQQGGGGKLIGAQSERSTESNTSSLCVFPLRRKNPTIVDYFRHAGAGLIVLPLPCRNKNVPGIQKNRRRLSSRIKRGNLFTVRPDTSTHEAKLAAADVTSMSYNDYLLPSKHSNTCALVAHCTVPSLAVPSAA